MIGRNPGRGETPFFLRQDPACALSSAALSCVIIKWANFLNRSTPMGGPEASRGTNRTRIKLRTVLAAVALAAVLCAILVPVVKRAFFPRQWNTWIVKTITRPDGSQVRVRIRRYPERDVVFEELLSPGSPQRPGNGKARSAD
jgi:hypothetical protein